MYTWTLDSSRIEKLYIYIYMNEMEREDDEQFWQGGGIFEKKTPPRCHASRSTRLHVFFLKEKLVLVLLLYSGYNLRSKLLKRQRVFYIAFRGLYVYINVICRDQSGSPWHWYCRRPPRSRQKRNEAFAPRRRKRRRCHDAALAILISMVRNGISMCPMVQQGAELCDTNLFW